MTTGELMLITEVHDYFPLWRREDPTPLSILVPAGLTDDALMALGDTLDGYALAINHGIRTIARVLTGDGLSEGVYARLGDVDCLKEPDPPPPAYTGPDQDAEDNS